MVYTLKLLPVLYVLILSREYSILFVIFITCFDHNSGNAQSCFVWLLTVSSISADCNIPIVLRNTWFSYENGRQTITDINASEMTGK